MSDVVLPALIIHMTVSPIGCCSHVADHKITRTFPPSVHAMFRLHSARDVSSTLEIPVDGPVRVSRTLLWD